MHLFSHIKLLTDDSMGSSIAVEILESETQKENSSGSTDVSMVGACHLRVDGPT
jgi:hypothetical protein